MPYKSEAQRRFFHSDGARKVGITPAMVEEYDEASRGLDLPDKTEKKANVVAWQLGKWAAQNMMAAQQTARVGNIRTNAPKSGVSKDRSSPAMNAAVKPEDLPGSLNPRGALDQFRSTASDNAQRATGDKLQAGESLTMPT